MVWGFSRFVLFLFLGLLRAPTRNSPERVRDTIWTFPEKSGKPPSLETPQFSFSQESADVWWIQKLGTQLTRQPPQGSSKGDLFVRVRFGGLLSTVEKVVRVRLWLT